MLLQTIVQLNILILATPALAGWAMLPMAQPGVVRAACVVLQSRTVEAVAPKAGVETLQTRQAARPLPAIMPRFAVAFAKRPVTAAPAFLDAAPLVVASFSPFPHAARAP